MAGGALPAGGGSCPGRTLAAGAFPSPVTATTATIAAQDATAAEVARRMTDDGYVIVTGMMSGEDVQAARDDLGRVLESTKTGRNFFEGFSTQRVYALFAKTRTFDEAAVHPLLLAVLDEVLGQYQTQCPGRDQDRPGREGADPAPRRRDLPAARTASRRRVNTMWPLDHFTEENGATRFVPDSHRWAPRPAPDRGREVRSRRCPPGSAMFYLGNLWHGGGANRTERPRLGVILEYVVSWLRPQENHCLAVPRALPGSCPSGCRSCSATTSIRLSSATSTALTRARCSPRMSS